jgi:type III restriction enzyme
MVNIVYIVNPYKLVEQCIERINSTISVNAIKVKIETVELSLESGRGVVTTFKGKAHEAIDRNYLIPDVVDYVSKETKLTRRTVVRILTGIKNLDLIFKDPQEFVSSVTLIIKETLAEFLIGGIKYLQINDWYKMELFKDIETNKDLILFVEQSIYEGIACDSAIEKGFAESLASMSNIKLVIKLPRWFVVDTPIGGYNPDWAIVMYDTNQFGDVKEMLYFVAETKGATNFESLRPTEKRKIGCAMRHFEAIKL